MTGGRISAGALHGKGSNKLPKKIKAVAAARNAEAFPND